MYSLFMRLFYVHETPLRLLHATKLCVLVTGQAERSYIGARLMKPQAMHKSLFYVSRPIHYIEL